MAVLQRSTRVQMSLDDAERCWNDFAAQSRRTPNSDGTEGDVGGFGNDPGTVYFTKVDDKTTEVTFQLDPTGEATGDESTMNERVDSVLQGFKSFVERQ